MANIGDIRLRAVYDDNGQITITDQKGRKFQADVGYPSNEFDSRLDLDPSRRPFVEVVIRIDLLTRPEYNKWIEDAKTRI